MLRISKLTDYATVVMSYLALHAHEIKSATQIAKSVHLKAPTVSKILKILSDAQLVKSYRGTGGGYQLARSAKEISVADVVSAVEGKLAMTECCIASNRCMLDSLCAMKENWKVINHIILKALAGVTLSEMTQPLTRHRFTLQGLQHVE